jgi:hypothetical protein
MTACPLRQILDEPRLPDRLDLPRQHGRRGQLAACPPSRRMESQPWIARQLGVRPAKRTRASGANSDRQGRIISIKVNGRINCSMKLVSL